MVIKIGINGFGRIGRTVFRKCLENDDLIVAALNDPAISLDYICYLIKFDSTHGKFKGDLTVSDGKIIINGNPVTIYHQKQPCSIPWSQAGVVYVVEASGMFTSYEKASGHLGGEVRRVFVTAPSVDVPMFVLGVNDNTLGYDKKVISCASSTLYCLAPIVKVLENNFGISEGFVTSIHAMTPSLKPLDGLCVRGKHWRDHRSIHQNIIPATTGACKALGKILPQVKGKLTGLAFRVPIVNVSVLDISIRLTTDTNLHEILKCIAYEKVSNMKNIINISTEEVVSSDFIGDRCSCTIDANSSMQLNSRAFKLICWYENEYSYACRVVDAIYFTERQHCNVYLETNFLASNLLKIQQTCGYMNSLGINKLKNKSVVLSAPLMSDTKQDTEASKSNVKASSSFMASSKSCENDDIKINPNSEHKLIRITNTEKLSPDLSSTSNIFHTKNTIQKVKSEVSNLISITEDILKKSRQSISTYRFFQDKKKDTVFSKLNEDKITVNDSLSKVAKNISNFKNKNDNNLLAENTYSYKTCETTSKINESLNVSKNDCGMWMDIKKSSEKLISIVEPEEIEINEERKCSIETIKESHTCSQDEIQYDTYENDASPHYSQTTEITKNNEAIFVNYVFLKENVARNIGAIINNISIEDVNNNTNDKSMASLVSNVSVPTNKDFQDVAVTESLNEEIKCLLAKIINNGEIKYKPDILDKLESVSGTDSENSFQVNEKKSQILNLMDLSNSLDDLAKLDKICKIIEISDELSEKLFLPLDAGNNNSLPCWSFKDLCRRINLDEFCNKVFGNNVN